MRLLIDHAYRLAYQLAHPLIKPVWWLLGRDLVGVFVAVWCDGRVLLVQNSYKHTRCFPGGMVDRGETPQQAGARELGEEVGVSIAADTLDHVHDLTQDWGRTRSHAYILEVDVTDLPDVAIDNREIIWAAFVTPAEALELPLPDGLAPYIRDAAARRGID